MKGTTLTVALSVALAACGHGHHNSETTVLQTIKVETESEFIDPMSKQGGVPYAFPFNYDQPIESWELKYLNAGVARAIAEYKMVGESLKTELAAKMGAGVDQWIKQERERCIADTADTFRVQYDWYMERAEAMCTGLAYGFWALVNGTGGTEGTPRQCLDRGYCGVMFKQYDLTLPAVPFIPSTGGLDNGDEDGIMMPSTTEQMGF